MPNIQEIIGQLGNARERMQQSGSSLNEAEAKGDESVGIMGQIIDKLGEVATLAAQLLGTTESAINAAQAAVEPTREAAGIYAQTTWGTHQSEAANLAGGAQYVASGAERLHQALLNARSELPSEIFNTLGEQVSNGRGAFQNVASQNGNGDPDSTLDLTDKTRRTIVDTDNYIALLEQEPED